MKKFVNRVMAITCAMMLTDGIFLSIAKFAEAYVPTYQMKDYYPFDDKEEETETVKTTPAPPSVLPLPTKPFRKGTGIPLTV